MSPQNALITGTNRGIGLEFVRQYLGEGWRVIGTVRDIEKADVLQEVGRSSPGELIVREMDLVQEDSIRSLARVLSERLEGLDLLINNAGTLNKGGTYGSHDSFSSLPIQAVRDVFDVNCLGAIRVTQKLLPLLEKREGNVVFITSVLGSLGGNQSGGYYPYRISKVALNMFGRTFARDFADRGIHALLLHPGWAQTRMGGPNATVEVEESVSGMRNLIEGLDERISGQVFSYDGTPLEW